MRQLKFKAWDKEKKVWIYPYPEPFYIIGETTVFDVLKEYSIQDYNNIEIVQFTGLLDKNNVEIYEGDILRVGKDLIEEVKWVDESNWMDKICPVNGWVNHASIYKKEVEVIGNSRQNKELLNENN